MGNSKKTFAGSIVVFIVAALLLELTTIIQFVHMRRSMDKQLTEMAQLDLSQVSYTAQLQQDVEATIDSLLPVVERLTAAG